MHLSISVKNPAAHFTLKILTNQRFVIYAMLTPFCVNTNCTFMGSNENYKVLPYVDFFNQIKDFMYDNFTTMIASFLQMQEA